jgi:hypothetical protein
MAKIVSRHLFIFRVLCLCGLMGVVCFPTTANTQYLTAIYSTGEAMELDRAASAWLIKRYGAPTAMIKLFPEGQFITEGIAFDTPDAALQRTHRFSTFEVVKRHFGIRAPELDALTRVVHETEINYWATKRGPQESKLVAAINETIRTTDDSHECLKRCFQLFDQFIQR